MKIKNYKSNNNLDMNVNVAVCVCSLGLEGHLTIDVRDSGKVIVWRMLSLMGNRTII